MNVLIITSIVVAATLAIGTGLASLFVRLSNVVVEEQEKAEQEKNSYNLGVTKGHRVPVEADYQDQLKEARKLAAKKAAVTPRSGNVRIGNFGESQPTAFDGIGDDPMTTVRVAHFHGWNILQTGAQTGVQTGGATQAAATAGVMTKRPEDLVAGEDYEFIVVTDDMEPAEIRRARIANAKAKSAAVKALKAAGGATGPAPTAAAQPAAASAQGQAAPVAAPAGGAAGSEPVAGVDYEQIEITDDMDPAAIRKARISNAKAKSAAMKAWKAAGGGASAPAPAAAAPAPAAPAQEAAPAQTAVTSDIPKPDLIEITDDMEPADIRKARISNAKAASAYKKALKAAGIDPSTVEL